MMYDKGIQIMLWFDVEIERITTASKTSSIESSLWFDVEIERITTLAP